MKRLVASCAAVFAISFVVAFSVARKGAPESTEASQPSVKPEPLAAAPTEAQPAPQIASFSWAAIDSPDNARLVANLRGIHCPEPTVADIVRARLRPDYAPRYAKTAATGNFADFVGEMRRKRAEKQRLDSELDSIIYDQLKVKHSVRSSNVLFTTEQEIAITEARERFPAVSRDLTDPASVMLEKSNHAARLEFLAQRLPPEQILFYKLDREGLAQRTGAILRGFQPSKDEFLAVASAVEGLDVATVNGVFTAETATALQGALAPNRFAFLQDLQRPEYRAVNVFVNMHQLSEEAGNELVRLRHDIFPNDPDGYARQLETVITNAQIRARYLSDRRIHPASK